MGDVMGEGLWVMLWARGFAPGDVAGEGLQKKDPLFSIFKGTILRGPPNQESRSSRRNSPSPLRNPAAWRWSVSSKDLLNCIQTRHRSGWHRYPPSKQQSKHPSLPLAAFHTWQGPSSLHTNKAQVGIRSHMNSQNN